MVHSLEGLPGCSPPYWNLKIYRFCFHDDIKRFTWYALQPNQPLKSAADQYIRNLKNKIKNVHGLRWNKKNEKDWTSCFNLLKPAGYMMHQQFNIQQLYALPTLYLCFVFIWEQTATCATYIINWLVFITEMKSAYCAVRTGSLNKAVCTSYLKG